MRAASWSVTAFVTLGGGDRATSLFFLLNPINHALTRSAVHHYYMEPYVVVADVYARLGHV